MFFCKTVLLHFTFVYLRCGQVFIEVVGMGEEISNTTANWQFTPGMVVDWEAKEFEHRQMAARIWSSVPVRALIGSKAAMSCLALPLVLSFVGWIRRKPFHRNVRLILLNMCVGLFAMAISGIVLYGEKLYKLFFFSADCDYTDTVYKCVSKRVVTVIASYQVLCSIVGIALERTYATLYFKKYETLKSIKFAVSVITIQVRTNFFY